MLHCYTLKFEYFFPIIFSFNLNTCVIYLKLEFCWSYNIYSFMASSIYALVLSESFVKRRHSRKNDLFSFLHFFRNEKKKSIHVSVQETRIRHNSFKMYFSFIYFEYLDAMTQGENKWKKRKSLRMYFRAVSPSTRLQLHLRNIPYDA